MDLKALGESLGLEEGEFVEIVEIFLETAYQDVGRLENACRNKDCTEASDAAHSLKGSAGNLGFMEISGIAAGLENKARKKDITGLDQVIPVISEKLDAIKALI